MKIKIPPLSSLISSRHLDWVNPDIKDGLFETPKETGTDFKLFHFDRRISSEDAIKDMAKQGYRPANAWELISWKDWNYKDYVVALGSVGKVDGSRYVPCLGRYVSERGLYLFWWGFDWNADYRFLGVRNGSVTIESSETGTLDTMPLTLVINGIKYTRE